LTPYDYSVEQRKASGAPVDWFLIPPAVARASGVGVVKTAKHPNAAVQFVDFALGDGQMLLADRKFTTASTKLDPPFLRQPVRIIDPAVTLQRSQRWTELFRKTFQ
jgi:iron(III) transport system substrate-binding protein